MLIETYRRLRNSIVAFVPKFAPDEQTKKHCASRQYLVLALWSTKMGSSLPMIMLFQHFPNYRVQEDMTTNGLCKRYSLFLQKGGWSILSRKSAASPDYPRLGRFQSIMVLRNQTLHLSNSRHVTCSPSGCAMYEEGEEVATAGFPMGTDLLTVPGRLHQISPTLQTGIVSAVHPFPCTTPHGFTIDVMVQGGASGSPVFNIQTGEVLGAIYSGIFDSEEGQYGSLLQHKTNYTYCVSSHFFVNSLSQVLAKDDFAAVRSESTSIKDFFAQEKPKNVLTGEPVEAIQLP
jgi:hypothetical protein